MNRIWVAAVLVGVVGGFATVAQASPIAIYNTGTNAAGTGLATPGSVDAHWVLESTPSSSTPTAAYDINNKPATWATNPNSQWIAPSQNGYAGQAQGSYSYQTTFDLTGFWTNTALLTGSFAADNCVTDILINGVSTGIANSGACFNTGNYTSFLSFSIATGFISGINTLTFLITNTANGGATNPSGLNVLISGTAKKIPEPGSLGLLGLALLGLGGMWVRRRT